MRSLPDPGERRREHGLSGADIQRTDRFVFRQFCHQDHAAAPCDRLLAGEARRKIAEAAFDIVLINAPLPDDFGMRLAVDICTGSGAGVLLLVRNDQFDDIYAKVVSYGVLTLSKPTNMQMVAQNLRILCATRERMRQMEAKQATVEEKIEEIRLVNRAKWLLIECLGMTEPEAHRYIEKQSMDQRISKREAAEAVIKTYK